MALSIKNDQTHRLVQELAKLTGETQTEAVTNAVLERIDRVRQARQERRAGLADRLLAIGKDAAPRFKLQYRYVDHADFLYDELGLPK